MDSKLLLGGIIGFLLGGLLVAVAATTFDKPTETDKRTETTMSDMTANLAHKNGDDFDKTFLSNMIEHHQAAIDMAELASDRAQHDAIKQLSKDIITTQQQEIQNMYQWQQSWGYTTDTKNTHAEHEM